MRGWSAVVLIATGCGVELPVADHAVIHCEADRDCPSDWRCGARGACLAPGAVEDLEAPRIVTAEASGARAVVITFNEPVDPASVSDVTTYFIAPALEAIGVSVEAQSVRLTTAPQTYGVVYGLTMSGVRDVAGNTVADPGASAQFTGGGAPPDTNPPALLAPGDDARFFDDDVILAWTAREGTSLYVVELAIEPTFATPLFARLETSATNLDLRAALGAPLEPRTYHWRVAGEHTDGSLANPGRAFHLMGDAIHVYCAADPCSSAPDIGNATRPHQSVAAALVDAAANGVREVRVAGRGGGLAYAGVVSLQPGVSLTGGWAPDFSGRDAAAHETILQHDGGFVVGGISINADAAADPSLVIDGFTIRTAAGSNLVEANAVFLSDCDGSVVLRNNVLRPDDAAGFSRGVVVTGSFYPTPVVITDNDIVAGRAYWGESTGVQVSFSRVDIVDNRVIAGNDTVEGRSAGIMANGAQLTITDNALIRAGDGPRNSLGLLLSGAGGEIARNVIAAGDAPANPSPAASIGLERNADAQTDLMLIADNEVSTGTAAFTYGMVLESGEGLTVRGNVVRAGPASSTSASSSAGIAIRKFGPFTIDGNAAAAGAVSAGAGGTFAYSAGLEWQRPASGFRASSLELTGNLLRGGSVTMNGDSNTTARSYGANLDGVYVQVSAVDNVLVAGTVTAVRGAKSVGLSFAPVSFTYGQVVNNTIAAGATASSLAAGASVGFELAPPQTATPVDVVNNVFMTLGASDVTRGVHETAACGGSCALPRRFEHNFVLHVAAGAGPTLYVDGDGTEYLDINADGVLDELSAVGGTVSGNRSVASLADPALLFDDPAGTLTPADPWDDYRPLMGSVFSGRAKNLTDSGGRLTDIVGTPRPSCGGLPCDGGSPGWCAGAYER